MNSAPQVEHFINCLELSDFTASSAKDDPANATLKTTAAVPESINISILLISFFYNISFVITKPFVPLLAKSLNASSSMIGILVSIQFFFPMILAIPAGQTVDFFGARRVLILGSLLIAFPGILYLYANDVWALFTAQIISGMGLLLVWLASQTVATQLHPGVGARDSFVGYFGSFSAAGQLLAPVLSRIRRFTAGLDRQLDDRLYLNLIITGNRNRFFGIEIK